MGVKLHKKTIILMAFLGLLSVQMNAQDQTFTGGLNGWNVAYGATGPVTHNPTGGVSGDGALVLSRVNNNSNFGLGTAAGIDADTNKYIKIIYKNETLGTDIRVQGSQDAANALQLSHTILTIPAGSPGTGEWRTAYIDMSSTTNWSGTVQNFDVLIRRNYASGEGNFYLDQIEFISTLPPDEFSGFVKNICFKRV